MVRMLKYLIAAIVLKCFSSSPPMINAYSHLGKTIGKKRRLRRGLKKSYLDQTRFIVEMIRKHGAISDHKKVLEVGTGWSHWASIAISLFCNVEVVMTDIKDNRQLEVVLQYAREFSKIIHKEMDLASQNQTRVLNLLQAISRVNSFDALYSLLKLKYVVDPSGTLQKFTDDTFDVVVSFDVLEHVRNEVLSQLVGNFHRVLKPGGYSIHQIDLCDHLERYNGKVCKKQYLKYSDTTWKRYFQNEVQYINRIQAPEWLHVFDEAGLELVEEKHEFEDIDRNRIDRKYEKLDLDALTSSSLTIVHKKPMNEPTCADPSLNCIVRNESDSS